MDVAREASRSRAEELTAEECWSLLRSATVGRLVWQGGDGLAVATVNYAVDGKAVLLRTLPYGTIARECEDSPVAFQVDHVDELARTGWSVLVRGRACFEYGDSVSRDLVDTWPSGSRTLPVRVVAREVTGRRLR